VNKPNFFIVGAPKCGTTAMNDYLAQHPDIFMAKKEIHYFGSDLKMRLKIYESEYLNYFNEAGSKKIIGEASVWYLFSQTAAIEIKKFSPGAKILIMLRNPVQVLHSLHSQHLYDGNENVLDFETAMNLDAERKNGNKIPDSLDFFELPPYRDSVLFARQVKRYLDNFGRENVHIILYEDFVANTEKAVRGTLDFLGVDSKIPIAYDVINPNKTIRFFSLHRLLKNPSWSLKRVVRIILPFKKLRHSIMAYLFKWNIRIKKRDKMDDRLYSRLKDSFTEDVNSLARIINRDLSGWL
jgi:hypothetical protein